MCAPLPQPQRHNCRIHYARGCSAELAAACRHTHAAAIMSAGQVLCCRLHACPQVPAARRSSGETHGREEVRTLSFANKQRRGAKHGTGTQHSKITQQGGLLEQ
jgi:hypothetical protein